MKWFTALLLLAFGLSAEHPHWALKPIEPTLVPAANMKHPIDVFIRMKRQETKLTASRKADRRTLIRRLHFDLHGLPPKPKAVEAFVRDPSITAMKRFMLFGKMSPSFGNSRKRNQYLRFPKYFIEILRSSG